MIGTAGRHSSKKTHTSSQLAYPRQGRPHHHGRPCRPGGHSEGQNTRSHPELGRENPQRQWYCALRRGRVGRRQARQTAQTHQTLIAGWSKPTLRTTPSGLVSLITVERPSEAKLSCWSNNTPERRSGAHRQDTHNAGWSSPVARQAHNLKVIGSNPIPATKLPCNLNLLRPTPEASPASGVSMSDRCPKNARRRVSPPVPK